MTENPFVIFKEWLEKEVHLSTSSVPTACCLSTQGLDGYPNARFVSFKEIDNERFIITGPINSRKGLEIEAHPKVALTFWWDNTEKQVRIQGNASLLSDVKAVELFHQRPHYSNLLTTFSQQGKELKDEKSWYRQWESYQIQTQYEPVNKPKEWGGFAIEPIRIELLEFSSSRLHKRKLFTLHSGKWEMHRLQP